MSRGPSSESRGTGQHATRQLAAIVCTVCVGYLSLATSCLDGGGSAAMDGRTTLEAGRQQRVVRLVSAVDGELRLVEVTTPGPETLRVHESELPPELSTGELRQFTSEEGVLTVECRQLPSRCHDLLLIVEREEVGDDTEVELHVRASASKGCGGERSDFFELRLEELP